MVHERLKALRTERNIQPKEMAELLHKSLSAYYRMENGEVKIDAEDIPALITALGCTLGDFYKDVATVNIQHNHNNEQPNISNAKNVYHESEKIVLQFQSFLEKMALHIEGSEKRSQEFMKEIIAKLKS